MRFNYTSVAVAQPVASLGGRTTRPWPVVMVSVIGPTGAMPVWGKLDTASDETLFSDDIAARIGVDLTNAPAETALTANQGALPVKYATITLRMTDGIEFRTWPALVGFAQGLRRPLLGFGGFLQFFTATFHGDDEIVELEVNRLYPGT